VSVLEAMRKSDLLRETQDGAFFSFDIANVISVSSLMYICIEHKHNWR